MYHYSFYRYLDEWFDKKFGKQTNRRKQNAHTHTKEEQTERDEQNQKRSKNFTENKEHKVAGNYYSILGVDQNSTIEEVQAAYRRRVKIVHPDRINHETHPDEWQQANQMLQELNDAYNHIKNHLLEDSSTNDYDQEKRTDSSQEKESSTSDSYNQERIYPQKGVTSCLIKDLSIAHVEFIKNLKNNSIDVIHIKTCYVLWRYIGFLIAGLIYMENIKNWSNLTYVIDENFWFGVLWLFFLSLIMAKCAVTIYSYHRAKIKPCLIFTPMYCIEIFNNKITFFYTWEIDSIYFHKKKLSYFNIKIGSLTKKMKLPKNFKFENYMKFESKYNQFKKFWTTIPDPLDWLTKNDILRDVKSSFVRRISVAALNSYSFFLVITTMVCILLFDSFTLVDKDFFARQKLHDHALRESSGRLYENTNSQDNSKVFNQPLQDLPVSGKEFLYTNDEGVAPLSIEVPSGVYHYYVKIVHAYTGQNVKSVFIRSGGKVEIDVPLGDYKVKYATGVNWYGRKYLFGPKTSVAICDDDFEFAVEGVHIKGYTLELIQQQGGNLHTSMISLDEF